MTSDGGRLLRGHIAHLLARRDEIGQEMLEAIQHEELAYTRFATGEQEAQWAQDALRLFDLFLQLAQEGRSQLTAVEMDAIRSTGATRADQGFDFPAVRASVRAAVSVARKYVVEEYEGATPADGASMRRVLEFLDWYGNQVEDNLHEGLDARNKERTQHGGKELARLVRDIESGAIRGDADFSTRVGALGCDEAVHRGMVLVADNRRGDDAVSRIRTQLPGVSILRRAEAATPHLLLLVAAPTPGGWSTLVKIVGAAAEAAKTTALTIAPCATLAQYHDRYAAAVVLVPHLSRLSDGRAVLDASKLVPSSVVASADPLVRQWLRRETLRGLDSRTKLFEFLALSTRLNFTLTAIERATGWDIKTVYGRRDELEAVTERNYGDPVDQAALTLGYFAACLDG